MTSPREQILGQMGQAFTQGQGGASDLIRQQEQSKLAQYLQKQRLTNSDQAQGRLSAQALVRDLGQSIGDPREYYDAIKSAEDLLNSGSPYTIGQVQTALARLAGEKGPLTEGDIQRGLKSTFKQDASGLAAYFGMDLGGQGLGDDQKASAQNLLSMAKSRLDERMKSGRDAAIQRAPHYGVGPKAAQTITQSFGSQYEGKPEQAGPYGPSVQRNGKTWNWNAQVGKYQEAK